MAVVAMLAALAAWARAEQPRVTVEFTEAGELNLALDGRPISQPSKTLDPMVRFRDSTAVVPRPWGADDKTWPVVPADCRPQASGFDAAERRLTQTFAWGEVVRTYRVLPGGVDIEVTVHNRSRQTLCEFQQRLFTLKLPAETGPALTTEAVYFGQAIPALQGDTLSGPVALPLVGAAGHADHPGRHSRAIVATTPETLKHLALRWETDTWLPPWDPKKVKSYAANDAAAMDLAAKAKEAQGDVRGETWWLTLAVGGDRRIFHDRFSSRPVPPGGSDTYVIWLRFGDARDPLAPAREALQAYGKAHPLKFSWPDRRPIVPTMIGDAFPYHPPEGPELQRPAAGPQAAEVRKRMLQHADDLIARMKTINAQGMIVWNIEGNATAGIKYVGDPRMIEYMCPEADAVADEFFGKIRAAGFRTGVCLRPSVIDVLTVKRPPGPTGAAAAGAAQSESEYAHAHFYPHATRSPADILAEKVAYAKKRWGCTLFYVDSNAAAGFWFKTVPFTDRSELFAVSQAHTPYRPRPEEAKAAAEAGWPRNADGSLKIYHDLLNEDVFAEVLRRHPDVLFTIEHTPLIQYTVNAPYDDGLAGLSGTPPVVRATWPEAFKCLSGLGGGTPGNFWRWVERSQKGDVVLGGGPFDMPEFLGAVAAASEYRKAGPPGELAAMGEEPLLAVAVDPKADARLRFYAAQQLCAGKPDHPTLDALLAAEGKLVPTLAIESLKTPEAVATHVGRFARLPGYKATWGFWTAPVREAMSRGGATAVAALVEHIARQPADARAGIDILHDTAGTNATAALAAFVADTALPQPLRWQAAAHLGWRKDATAAQKDAVLDFLVPMLGDPTTRMRAANELQPRYASKAGLWHNDPRVREAASAAAEKEKAEPKPDATFLAILDKIVTSRP